MFLGHTSGGASLVAIETRVRLSSFNGGLEKDDNWMDKGRNS